MFSSQDQKAPEQKSTGQKRKATEELKGSPEKKFCVGPRAKKAPVYVVYQQPVEAKPKHDVIVLNEKDFKAGTEFKGILALDFDKVIVDDDILLQYVEELRKLITKAKNSGFLVACVTSRPEQDGNGLYVLNYLKQLDPTAFDYLILTNGDDKSHALAELCKIHKVPQSKCALVDDQFGHVEEVITQGFLGILFAKGENHFQAIDIFLEGKLTLDDCKKRLKEITDPDYLKENPGTDLQAFYDLCNATKQSPRFFALKEKYITKPISLQTFKILGFKVF